MKNWRRLMEKKKIKLATTKMLSRFMRKAMKRKKKNLSTGEKRKRSHLHQQDLQRISPKSKGIIKGIILRVLKNQENRVDNCKKKMIIYPQIP